MVGAAAEPRTRYGAAAPNVKDDDHGESGHKFVHGKEARRTWDEHFLYTIAVSDERGGADSLVLDKIVQHTSPELINVMPKYDPTRSDYLRHAEELAHFA